MLITRRFVYIHMPKTGGTFVTSVLRHLHAPPAAGGWRRRLRAKARRLLGWPSTPYGPLEDREPKHATCREVPGYCARLPLVSNVRSPFDWYVSQYEFGWWKRTFEYHPVTHPTPAGAAIEAALPDFQRSHPHFPDLRFPEFIDLCTQAAGTLQQAGAPALGLCTHSFLRYFFRDPAAASRDLTVDHARRGIHRAAMYDVTLLRAHRLNQDLHRFLLGERYRPDDLEFILHKERVLPMGRGRSDDQPWQAYYSPDLLHKVRELDRLMLAMFNRKSVV